MHSVPLTKIEERFKRVCQGKRAKTVWPAIYQSELRTGVISYTIHVLFVQLTHPIFQMYMFIQSKLSFSYCGCIRALHLRLQKPKTLLQVYIANTGGQSGRTGPVESSKRGASLIVVLCDIYAFSVMYIYFLPIPIE